MKGSVLDFAFLIGLFLVIAITVVFASKFLTELEPALGNASINTTFIGQGKDAIGVWDNMFIVLAIGAMMAVVVGASLIRTHPVFAIISVFVLILIIFVSLTFSNFYNLFVENEQVSEEASELVATNFIMFNLPLLIAIFGFIFLIVMFGKVRGQGEA